jgi:hypothetical protein
MKQLATIALLATALAGGYGAERDAAKEAPIDWPARAASVKVGMTPAEVEKILPRWVSPQDLEKRDHKAIQELGRPLVFRSSQNRLGMDQYHVAEDWLVQATYFSSESDDPQKMRLIRLCINKITRPSDDRKVWVAKAASIKVGMTRAEVERNLPAWAFVQTSLTPKTEARHEVYWFAEDWVRRNQGSGATWALTIDYDGTGGGSSENRVIKPVKIATFEKPYPQIPWQTPFPQMLKP